MRDTDRPQRKVFELQLACYVLDAANLLPRMAIAAPARQITSLVS